MTSSHCCPPAFRLLAGKSQAEQPKGQHRMGYDYDPLTQNLAALQDTLESKYIGLNDRLRALEGRPSAKAAAILGGTYLEEDHGPHFLKALADWKIGRDHQAELSAKAILGISAATGQAIVPNNFVAGIAEINVQANPYRQLMNVQTVSAGLAVDIPYEVTGYQAALLQGAYGSNKDVRDHAFGEATATLYQIATIVDVGNQLLRHSEGAAEANVRRRLGKYFGLAEGNFVINGTGSSQPLGILQAILAFGDIAAHKYTLNSESRAAAIGNGVAKLEARGERATAVVMNPTDYWEMATETLGTGGAGGWAFDAATGPTGGPIQTIWGIPVYRDANLPSGTALAGSWADCDIYVGGELTIDVSSEAGSRFDQNITGFRAEEEFGFNAEPYVRTGKFVKILGL
jgi:HK97 family phage major capsid protein